MPNNSTLTDNGDRLLTDVEACEYLRIRQRQLYNWRQQGFVPFIRIGRSIRYRKRDLDVALDAMTVRISRPSVEESSFSNPSTSSSL